MLAAVRPSSADTAGQQPTCSEPAPRHSALPPRRDRSHPGAGSWRPREAYEVHQRPGFQCIPRLPSLKRPGTPLPLELRVLPVRLRRRRAAKAVEGDRSNSALGVFFSTENRRCIFMGIFSVVAYFVLDAVSLTQSDLQLAM